jgi:hypothetical protein
MKISTIVLGVAMAVAAFTLAGHEGFAQQVHTGPGVHAVQQSDTTLSDRVAALEAQVKQLTAQVQALTKALAQTTKTANDANFKAGLATAWINANGKNAQTSGNGGAGAHGGYIDDLKGPSVDVSSASPKGPEDAGPPASAVDTPPQKTSYPASATTMCVVADVHTYSDRMHIRCKQAIDGSIFYFASESGSTVSAQLQVLNAIQFNGLVNKLVAITYAPDPGQNPAGCLTSDCRRLLGTKS